AFGEMVALLWAQGNTEAAIRLEQLWNQLAEKHSFHLHCAYPLSLFPHASDTKGMERICVEHSQVTPGERFTQLPAEDARLRTIAVLQQKAQALEGAVREREQAQTALKKREAELSDFL